MARRATLFADAFDQLSNANNDLTDREHGMSKRSLYAASVVGAALLSMGGLSLAQTAGNGPYYAAPSWDQTFPAATRFLVLTNFAGEAVLDRETGLVWQRQPFSDRNTFSEAYERCINAAIGGKFGWRLPSIAELRTLFDASATSAPFLLAGHPFQVDVTQQQMYWSSTTGASYSSDRHRFVLGFTTFGTQPSHMQQVERAPYQAWCVRAPGDMGPYQF